MPKPTQNDQICTDVYRFSGTAVNPLESNGVELSNRNYESN